MNTLVVHPNARQLAVNVADRIDEDLRVGLSSTNTATLALAGGSTPLPIYNLLAERPLAWHHVAVVPTDERWVAADHVDRNSSRLADALSPASPRFVALVDGRPSGNTSTEFARESLREFTGIFDHVLLGMGSDGHFASLFPGSPLTAITPHDDQDVVAVVPDPLPKSGPYPRISLTLSRLLRARRITLALTGEEKRQTFERAVRKEADPSELPIAALVRAAGSRLSVHWSPTEHES